MTWPAFIIVLDEGGKGNLGYNLGDVGQSVAKDARNESTPRLDFLHWYIPKTRRQSQRIKDEADDDDG